MSRAVCAEARYFARIYCSNGFSNEVMEVTAEGPGVLRPGQYYVVSVITVDDYDEFNETGHIRHLERCMRDGDGWLSREETRRILDNFESGSCHCGVCQSCTSPNGTDCGHG